MQRKNAVGAGRAARRFGCMVAVLAAVLAHPIPAARAADGDDPPGYDEAIAQALSELQVKNFPEAREEFRRAHALSPNARTLRGLGMVEFELRNYRECARLLEQSLASGAKPLDERLRNETKRLLVRARRYLGELHVETDPPTATVLVDGTGMALGGSGSLLLEVGEHTLAVHAPGRSSERRLVQIRGGERIQVRVALARLLPEGTSPLVVQGNEEDKPHYKKWWVWSVAAVVAVGAGTTAGILFSRLQDDASSKGADGSPVELYSAMRF